MCLHAGVADTRMWYGQMEGLGSEFDIVAFDRRGFGKTEAKDEPFSHVEDLAAVVDYLDIEKVPLVAASLGGRIAIDFAVAHPERVRSLFLIGPAVSGAPVSSNFSPLIQERIDRMDEADDADDLEGINRYETIFWLDGPEQEEGRISGPLRDTFLDMNRIALEADELEHEQASPPAYPRLAEISVPTYVMWGSFDFANTKNLCRHLIETVPNARGEEIEGCAHLPNYERPDIVNPIMRAFHDFLL